MQATHQSKFNTNNIIQHLRKIQFVCEFFILSKVSENHDSVPQMLMAIEAFKFYFKSIAVAESKGIYIEVDENKKEPEKQIDALLQQKSTVDDEIDRERKLLELIKQKPYESYDYYPKMFQHMANGKKMQMVTASKLPSQLQKSQLKFKHIIGELLSVLRPLVSIICIRIFGIDSYKSYFISLLIDLVIIVVFQRGLKLASEQQKKEMKRRKMEIIMRYIFRRPFFLLLKKILIQPLLAKIIKPERVVSKLILSLIQMQSSISLTL